MDAYDSLTLLDAIYLSTVIDNGIRSNTSDVEDLHAVSEVGRVSRNIRRLRLTGPLHHERLLFDREAIVALRFTLSVRIPARVDGPFDQCHIGTYSRRGSRRNQPPARRAPNALASMSA